MNNDGRDVGWIQDFLFYLQNAIALEHHCISSYAVTKDKTQLQILEKVRRTRSKWMYRFIKDSKNQIYCESKHLLAMSAGLKEIGNRYIEAKETALADECFTESQECEALFILINQEVKNA